MSEFFADPGAGGKAHRFVIDGSGYVTPVVRIDAGGVGINASSAQPTLAAITGAGNVLLATLTPDQLRSVVVIQNQSAATIIVVGDPGASDVDIWTYLLTGVGAGQQGGELPAELGRFKGRLRVYGATGARVAVVGI